MKVTSLNAPTEIPTKHKKLTKQYCVVSDSTGACRSILWENNVGQLKEGGSYSLNDVKVKEFANTKFLSITVDTKITTIDDIGEVIELDPDDLAQSEHGKLVEGKIISVIYEDYRACLICNSKVSIIDNSTTSTNLISECIKCKAKSKYHKDIWCY